MSNPTPTLPALFDVRESARYLGVSVSFFQDSIRPYVTAVDLRAPGSKKPLPRWERSELDAFVVSRRPSRKSA